MRSSSVVSATVEIDQFNPAARETFEGVNLRRIDHVLNDTSDHGWSLNAVP
jgi:hypothetical protein